MDETWTLTVRAFTILTTDNPSFSVVLFYSRLASPLETLLGVSRSGVRSDSARASVWGIPSPHNLSSDHSHRHLGDVEHCQYARPSQRVHVRRHIHRLRRLPHRITADGGKFF